MPTAPIPELLEPPSPASFPDSPLSRSLRQPMMLGVFMPMAAWHNYSTTLPRSTSWTFDYNAELARKADALGFDILFARAKWLPKGAEGEAGDASIDPFIATGTFAPITRRILLISTLNILFGPLHPVHVAKFGSTLDHISGGRWGLNIVTGHFPVEHRMFGGEIIEHDLRYRLADEFMRVVKHLWAADENLTYAGLSSWRMQDAYVAPKPSFGRPVIVNATGSPAGIDFAVAHSDIIFVTSPAGNEFEAAIGPLAEHIRQVRSVAAAAGRDIRVLLHPFVICRPTEAEAWAHARNIVAHSQRNAASGNEANRSDSIGWGARSRPGVSKGLGLGASIDLVGSPEQIVDYIRRLKAAGVDGLQLYFHDFRDDLDFFGAHVLPLLEQAGLRLPVDAAAPLRQLEGAGA